MDILKKTGDIFPGTRGGALSLGIAMGIPFALNLPEASLAVLVATMATKAWVKYRNNDLEEDVQPAGLSATVDQDDGEDVELPETAISSGPDIDGEDCDACTI